MRNNPKSPLSPLFQREGFSDKLAVYRDILNTAEWHTDESRLPSAVRKWLCYPHSLTEKLQQYCQTFTVEITQQGWLQGGSSGEKFTNQGKEWLREVILNGDGTPWVFAQTVLPESTIHTVAQDILTLGERPIGLWLFPQNPIRQRLEWTQDTVTGLYARRSILELKGYPLTIYELFLPDFNGWKMSN